MRTHQEWLPWAGNWLSGRMVGLALGHMIAGLAPVTAGPALEAHCEQESAAISHIGLSLHAKPGLPIQLSKSNRSHDCHDQA